MPEEWYDAPPSDAMIRCRSYFEAHPCTRLLDLGCGFGRWAQFLDGHGVGEIVGLDYAGRGVRLASAWAKRAGSTPGSSPGRRLHCRFMTGLSMGCSQRCFSTI